MPRKYLEEDKDKLNEQSAGAVKKQDGSHQTTKATVTIDGVPYVGFYKRVDPKGKYTELQAKLSVAASLFMRSFLGDKAAEEWLVYKNKGKENEEITGSFSFAIPEFTALLNREAPELAELKKQKKELKDLENREALVPTTATLIANQFMDLLVASWFMQDDDVHPGNLSLKGRIDFEMVWYFLIILLKGARVGVDYDYKEPNITPYDYGHFPNIKAKIYHWAAFQNPGQNSLNPLFKAASPLLPKGYPDPAQIAELENRPEAQAQKVASVMQILLTFEPEILEERLKELFGDSAFNYTSLGPELSKLCQDTFPDLFNPTTNRGTFVSFMMALFQLHYDALYRTVVFYTGNKEDKTTRHVTATSEDLYRRPSLFWKIREWIIKENQTNYTKETQLDTEIKLKQRYHQIWRDSHLPDLKGILQDTYRLIVDIQNLGCNEKRVREFDSTDTSDPKIKRAFLFICDIPTVNYEEILKNIALSPTSDMVLGLKQVCDVHNRLVSATKAYFQKDKTNLTQEDNSAFVKALYDLREEYRYSIMEHFKNSSTYADKYFAISTNLKNLIEHIDFKMHLISTDEQMRVESTTRPAVDLPLTHPEVIDHFNRTLFAWVNKLSPEKFNRDLEDIIDNRYSKVISLRTRGPLVKAYLNATLHLPNNTRLAYILGSVDNAGSLNQAVIEHFAQKVKEDVILIPSLSSAINDRRLFIPDNLILYATQVNIYAKNNFVIKSLEELEQESFLKCMYEGIDRIEQADFKTILENTERAYLAAKNRFIFNFSTYRTGEVSKYVESLGKMSNREIFVRIFKDGSDTSTLSRELFNLVREHIKTHPPVIDSSIEAGFKKIQTYDASKDYAIYFPLMKQSAIEQDKLIKEAAKLNSTLKLPAENQATAAGVFN